MLTPEDRNELMRRIETARDACIEALNILDDADVNGVVYNEIDAALDALINVDDAAKALPVEDEP